MGISDIISIIISCISLGLSIASFIRSMTRIPVINNHAIQITLHGDGFDLLFSENGQDIKRQKLQIANYNDRDVLIHMISGYICNNDKRYDLNPCYFTLAANRITTVSVTADPGKVKNKDVKDRDYCFKFKYQNLFWVGTRRIQSPKQRKPRIII